MTETGNTLAHDSSDHIVYDVAPSIQQLPAGCSHASEVGDKILYDKVNLRLRNRMPRRRSEFGCGIPVKAPTHPVPGVLTEMPAAYNCKLRGAGQRPPEHRNMMY